MYRGAAGQERHKLPLNSTPTGPDHRGALAIARAAIRRAPPTPKAGGDGYGRGSNEAQFREAKNGVGREN